MKDEGIDIQTTPPRTPEANSPGEHSGGLITKAARTMLLDSRLPEMLWPYTVDMGVYMINRLINTNNNMRPPLKLWCIGLHFPVITPSLQHLQAWGCLTYKHTLIEDRQQGRKYQPKAEKGYLVGYDSNHGHVYKIWILRTGKVHQSRDVTFDENREKYCPPPTDSRSRLTSPDELRGPQVHSSSTPDDVMTAEIQHQD